MALKWPILCWCAVKKLLTHLTSSKVCILAASTRPVFPCLTDCIPYTETCLRRSRSFFQPILCKNRNPYIQCILKICNPSTVSVYPSETWQKHCFTLACCHDAEGHSVQQRWVYSAGSHGPACNLFSLFSMTSVTVNCVRQLFPPGPRWQPQPPSSFNNALAASTGPTDWRLDDMILGQPGWSWPSSVAAWCMLTWKNLPIHIYFVQNIMRYVISIKTTANSIQMDLWVVIK